RIGAAAVCIGPAGFGRWHEMEMRGFIDEFNRRELPVISVLLLPPGAPDPQLPLFLRHFTWVDFRNAEPNPLDRLVWGVTGQRPAGLGE
ncbi:MAG: transcriptional regulator, partial [Burkholderiales bacterium PBB5]